MGGITVSGRGEAAGIPDTVRAAIDVFDQAPDRESAVLYLSALENARPV